MATWNFPSFNNKNFVGQVIFFEVIKLGYDSDCLCFQTGELKEYDTHKEMTSDVVCMALGNAPSGEQMSRFLAVGLADNTVRIISLDPDVSQPSFMYVKSLFLK